MNVQWKWKAQKKASGTKQKKNSGQGQELAQKRHEYIQQREQSDIRAEWRDEAEDDTERMKKKRTRSQVLGILSIFNIYHLSTMFEIAYGSYDVVCFRFSFLFSIFIIV